MLCVKISFDTTDTFIANIGHIRYKKTWKNAAETTRVDSSLRVVKNVYTATGAAFETTDLIIIILIHRSSHRHTLRQKLNTYPKRIRSVPRVCDVSDRICRGV